MVAKLTKITLPIIVALGRISCNIGLILLILKHNLFIEKHLLRTLNCKRLRMKLMLTRRFFISWILAAVVMFSLSYLWHGVFLNDFSRLNYPKQVFFIIAILVYLFISLGISLVYPNPKLDSLKKTPLRKGALIGAGFGMALYLMTLVIGVSFTRTMSFSNILFDCGWQMFEQAAGGVFVGLASIFVPDEHLFDSDHH